MVGTLSLATGSVIQEVHPPQKSRSPFLANKPYSMGKWIDHGDVKCLEEESNLLETGPSTDVRMKRASEQIQGIG